MDYSKPVLPAIRIGATAEANGALGTCKYTPTAGHIGR
jgi:hypothetical protein